MSAHAPQHMRQRQKRDGMVLHTIAAKRFVGAGVAVTVPAVGAIATSATAHAAPVPSTPSTSTPTASTPRPLVYFGSRGAAVKLVQTRVGAYADGIYGQRTLVAVKTFQTANGLVADGVVGPLTWAKIDGVAQTEPTPAPTTPTPVVKTLPPTTPVACPTNATTLRYGTTSPLVKVLQSRLGLETDGWFGPATLRKVKAFQASNGLVADGIVGPLTWGKLGCTAPSAPVSTTPAPTTPAPAPTTPTTPVVSTPTTPVVTTPAPTGKVTGDMIIAEARKYVGTPYLWGGSTPAGFDCSGFVSYVYKQFGITMPRTSSAQMRYFPATSNPQPGDLLFYGSPAYHVAIYVGDGMMIDSAHPGTLVNFRKIYGAPSGYARVLN